MAIIKVKSSYLLRKDTSTNWNSKNPILGNGEMALETDTGKIKVGDGTTAYKSLGNDRTFFPGGGATGDFATKEYVDNGLAGKQDTLDSGSLVTIDTLVANQILDTAQELIIKGLAEPTNDTQATPKSYVDGKLANKIDTSAFEYNDTTGTLTITIG